MFSNHKGKARRREGDAAGEKNACRDEILFVFHRKRRRAEDGYGACYLKGHAFSDRGGMIPAFLVPPAGLLDSSLRGFASPYFSNKEFRLGPGRRWQQQKEGSMYAAAPAPFLVMGQQVRIY